MHEDIQERRLTALLFWMTANKLVTSIRHKLEAMPGWLRLIIISPVVDRLGDDFRDSCRFVKFRCLFHCFLHDL